MQYPLAGSDDRRSVSMASPRPLRAVLTGGSSGIGRAVALRLAGPGAVLHLPGRSTDRLEATRREIVAAGGQAVTDPLDLADADAVRSWARSLGLAEGLDLLVHAAGTIRLGPLAEATDDDFERLFAVNVAAPFLLTRELLPALRRAGGQVAFVNSTSGRAAPGRGGGLYAASKHALRAMADALRCEENRLGVRVLSVFPGRTATPMQEAVVAFEGGAYRPERLLQPEDVAEALVHALSMPRTAEVTEVDLRPFQPPD
jgi:NAD(P)-dependent dehydrogenase (short-subunit alcohol dehydrogenase family)